MNCKVDTIYLPIILAIARSIFLKSPANILIEDLIQVGHLGLMDAHKKHNGSNFRAYARQRITGEMIDWVREQSMLGRGAFGKTLYLEDIEHDEAVTHSTPFDHVYRNELAGIFDKTVSDFSARDRKVVYSVIDGAPMATVGKRFKVSESRVCQIWKLACSKAKERLRS